MSRTISPLLAITTLVLLTFASTGCVEVDLARQLMDKFVPEKECEYKDNVLRKQSGKFVPESDQDLEEIVAALSGIPGDPTKAAGVFENISWRHFVYSFKLPEKSRSLSISVLVDWQNAGSDDNYIGGDVTVVVTDPNGNVCTDCDVNEPKLPDISGDPIKDPIIRIYPPSPIPGEWSIDVSGTGLDGIFGDFIYRGDFTVMAHAKTFVKDSCKLD